MHVLELCTNYNAPAIFNLFSSHFRGHIVL